MPQSPENTKYLKENFIPVNESVERIARLVVDAAYTVHINLGPGLLEKVYVPIKNFLNLIKSNFRNSKTGCHELEKRGLNYKRQVDIPIIYDNLIFNEGLRLDVLVEDCIVCELKALETVNPVWEAQILSHLKLTGKRLGFLINFNVVKIKDGIRRFVI
jgi:GxxExxY protein